MAYLSDATATTFSLEDYLADLDIEMLKTSEGRRELSKLDPLLFAVYYFEKTLTNPHTGLMTFADMHFDIYRRARLLALPMGEPMQDRDAFIAPRNAAKSTLLFKIIPLWALAHGHRKFVAAYSETTAQAKRWMGNLKHELDSNKRLRDDFPELCTPMKRAETGRASEDNQNAFISSSDAILFATGIDSTSLGLNYHDRRPDVILFDDIEPDASNYSLHEKEKRLHSVRHAVLPQEEKAQVFFVGTVHMPGAIFHDFVVHNDTKPESRPADVKWVSELNIRVHHYEPIVVDRTTHERRSYWPGQWPTSHVLKIEGTEDFDLSWANRPKAADGSFWKPKNFTYGSLLDGYNIGVLSIDHATTVGKKSDDTAFAAVLYDSQDNMWEVLDCQSDKITPGAPVVHEAVNWLRRFPQISAVIIEMNQGGMWVSENFQNLSEEVGRNIEVWTVQQPSNKTKEDRAKTVLHKYQGGRVLHGKPLPAAEAQMTSFPKGLHDDMVDAIVTGVIETESRYGITYDLVTESYYQ